MRLDQLQHTRILGAERDPFLHALLGLHALCARFDALVSTTSTRAYAVASDDSSDEIPELALLGALRLRHLLATYEATLQASAAQPSHAETGDTADHAVRFPTALLR